MTTTIYCTVHCDICDSGSCEHAEIARRRHAELPLRVEELSEWRPSSPPERADAKRQTEILDAAVKQFGSAGESHPAGRPALNELLESARKHVMTAEEKEAQRQSWVRGEMALSESERGMTSVLPPSAHVCKFPDSPTDGREWSCSQCNVLWCWQAGVWEAVGEVEVSQPSAPCFDCGKPKDDPDHGPDAPIIDRHEYQPMPVSQPSAPDWAEKAAQTIYCMVPTPTLAEITAVLRSSVLVSATPTSFWVVERFDNEKGVDYWDGGSSRSFVSDIDKAIQFRRREDAFWATRGWHWTDVKLTEHVYMAASAQTHDSVPAAPPISAEQWWQAWREEWPKHHPAILPLDYQVIPALKAYASRVSAAKDEEIAQLRAEHTLYALLRGICENVIDWLATLSYDAVKPQDVLTHPLTIEIRHQLDAMYKHPLDDKLLLTSDQVENKLAEVESNMEAYDILDAKFRKAESELQVLRAKQQRATELMRKLVNFVKDRNHCPESHNCAECEIIVPIYLEAEKLLVDSEAQREEK